MSHFVPFHMHASLALQFIALVSGVLLLNKACGEGFFCMSGWHHPPIEAPAEPTPQ